MAAPFYEKSTGVVVIEWYESKETSSSPTRHHYEEKPIKLQLHPKDPSKVIRIYFDGKMPAWMNRYVKEKEHPFECKEVFQNGAVGWWIANWRRFDIGKPFTAPTIKGCINAFINLIPSVVEDYRERVISGTETIAANLAIEPLFYAPFGLYYRPEEITGDGGAMVADEDLFPVRMSEETDLDFETRIRSHGKLDRLIFELTTPLPVSITEDEEENHEPDEEVFELSYEEGEFTLTFEGEEEAASQERDPLSGYTLNFSEEETEQLLTFEEDSEEAGIQQEKADPDPTGCVEHLPSSEGEDPGSESVGTVDAAVSEPVEPEKPGEPELVATGSVFATETVVDKGTDQEESEEVLQLHIVSNSSRKHCAVAGQLSFF